ncbi:MAG: cation:proton antiporter [Planctomyces sp.]|nr:cation:proton antiporter [Planctomyces sp.]
MHDHLEILLTLTAGLTGALVLGYITQMLRLSPIVGYLLAGMVIGPRSPGFVADQDAANQFAEVGVILLMFGVGLHFHLRDLLAVRRIAVPGAVGQIAVATLLGALAMVASGRTWGAGLVVGVSISVASTVVLIRVLSDNDVLHTNQGHIAVGWLIVEDLFTVFVLVLLPALATLKPGEGEGMVGLAGTLALAVFRVGLLVLLVLGAGRKAIPWVLSKVARTRNRELFTLTVLALALAIAVGSSFAFGVSMALGAFLAGMVVGQSEVSHQAAADALPMRDAFAVLFFVSVGMLFDPTAVWQSPVLFLGLLSVVLVAKPLAAFVIVWALGYSFSAALTVSVALAQIGEFSFIVAQLAKAHRIVGATEESLLVACAIVSITLNPLLFRGIIPVQNWLRQQRPKWWKALNRRSEARLRVEETAAPLPDPEEDEQRAIILGYGPVGRTAAAILRDFGIRPVVIDLNVDTVRTLRAGGELAIYGDASQRQILHDAGIESARYLLITFPDLSGQTTVVINAREMNPELRIFIRARYLAARAWLDEIGVTEATFEEAEAAIGLASLLLKEVGASEDRIAAELRRLREKMALRPGGRDSESSAPGG